MEDDLFLVRRQLVEKMIAEAPEMAVDEAVEAFFVRRGRVRGAVGAVHPQPVRRRRERPGAVHGGTAAGAHAARIVRADQPASVEDLQGDPEEAVDVDHAQTHVVEPRVQQDPPRIRPPEPRVADAFEPATLAEILAEHGPADSADQVGQVRRV